MSKLRWLIIVLFGVTMTAGFTLPQTSAAVLQTRGYPTGGLGLTLDEFQARFGPGDPGQSYLSFVAQDGAYYVGLIQPEQLVSYIERSWDEGMGVPLADAQIEAGSLLPNDAKFVESYTANSVRILYGTQVDRYQSATISQQLRGDQARYGSNIVIIYHLVPATDVFDVVVDRFMIVPAQR